VTQIRSCALIVDRNCTEKCTEKCTEIVQKSGQKIVQKRVQKIVPKLYRKLYRNFTENCTEIVHKIVPKLYRKVYRNCTENCTKNCTENSTGIVPKILQELYRKLYRNCTENCTEIEPKIVQKLYRKLYFVHFVHLNYQNWYYPMKSALKNFMEIVLWDFSKYFLFNYFLQSYKNLHYEINGFSQLNFAKFSIEISCIRNVLRILIFPWSFRLKLISHIFNRHQCLQETCDVLPVCLLRFYKQ